LTDHLQSWAVYAAAAVVVVFLLQLILVLKQYRKVGPNRAMIISGAFTQGGSRVVIDGGAFVWPLIQEAHFLSLEVVPVEVSTASVYTRAGVPVVGTASIQVKVLKNQQSVLLAAQQFLSQGVEGIARATAEVVKGHLSIALSQATAEDLDRGPAAFGDKVGEDTTMDLAAMGLEIVSFSVRQEPAERNARNASV
jgi:flotillin